MVCALGDSDTLETLLLLGARPLHNVFLEYVVRAGGLGRMRGFMGYRKGKRLQAVLLIGPLGGTSLEVHNAEAYAPLAEAAHLFPMQPRHIVGPEEITTRFWEAYSVYGARPRWERREPMYMITERDLARAARRGAERLQPATESDLIEIVENSALQHREDLKDDPYSVDPEGFRARHENDIRENRWWVIRERGRVAFQVHVGAENDRTVQIGGVMTPPELRNQGFATRGLTVIARQLLERRPAVSLFCDESNLAARHIYEKLGFQKVFYYRSWLLDPPSPDG